MKHRLLQCAAVIGVCAAAIAHLPAQDRVTKAEADRFQGKLTRILELGKLGTDRRAKAVAPASTQLTDA